MRFLTRPLLALFTALSLAGAGRVQAQATINVAVIDNEFQPATVLAAPGDNIVFTYTGSRSHPVVSDNSTTPAFAPFTMSSANRTRTVVMTSAGTYGYHCQLHGAVGVGMFGTILVQPLGVRPEAPVAPGLTTYPNPASASRDERVGVSFTQRAGTEGKLRLLNIIGRVVRETPIRRAAETAETRLALDITNLPAGVYFASLVIGERAVETHRVVVQP